MNKIISFPHLGYYYVVFNYFISNVTKCKVLLPPISNRKTINLGAKYSPDFVCVPFKYNLGNYIEVLEKGANVLIQGGGGCRYGTYAELQEKILRDLGYNFEFYNLIVDNHISLKKGYKFCKKMNNKVNPFKCLYYLINSLFMIVFIDNIEKYIRGNIGFEIVDGEFEKLENEMFLEYLKSRRLCKIIYLYFKYKRLFKHIKINKPNDCLKVYVIGELYSLIDSNTTYNLERKIAKMGVFISRKTDLTYLMITKRFILNKIVRKSHKYIKYNLGADASTSVYLASLAGKRGYDGVIHLKSFGCTPEVSALTILPKIAEEYDIPIMSLSFDAEDNECGIDTRIEAFYDMIERRKK